MLTEYEADLLLVKEFENDEADCKVEEAYYELQKLKICFSEEM